MKHIKPLISVNPEGWEENARRLLERKPEEGGSGGAGNFNFPESVVKSDYILVPGVRGVHGGQVSVSKFEIAGANGKNYDDTHRFVLQNGLYVPPTAIFMPHFSNVLNAYQGNARLIDGDGNDVKEDEVKDIYKHLTMDHIAAYGDGTDAGTWTWLNGKFIQGSGFDGLDLELIVGLKQNGTFETRSEKLANCLNGSGVYADLAWNAQGFPTNPSGDTDYRQGQNIRFWKPVQDRVAGFDAGSSGADLGCGWDPTNSDASLGVFACAEGAAS